MEFPRYRHDSPGFIRLWLNWTLSVGAIAATLFSVLFISKLWLPAVALAFQFMLMGRVKLLRQNPHRTSCCLLPYLVARILFFSAIIMVGINIYVIHFIDPMIIEQGYVNPQIPYVTVLILGPVSTVVTAWAYFTRFTEKLCYNCRMKFGGAANIGYVAKVLLQERQLQLRMLLTASVLITIYSWAYYLTHYSNVNFSESDLFYYIWIPIILYLFSVINLGIRYVSLDTFFHKNMIGGSYGGGESSELRYLLLSEDRILLTPVGKEGEEKLDTPARCTIPYRERRSEYEALTNFRRIAGIVIQPHMKFLYENADINNHGNVFHYVCELSSSDDIQGSDLEGEWYTQGELRRMVDEGALAPELMAEVERIYAVTIAVKTYDSNGRRLYDIKHYRPSFKLRDISNPDIDYNDPHWLLVAKDNEDKPFFHLKRFWRRYVRGIEYNL